MQGSMHEEPAMSSMPTVNIIYWEEDGAWLGYLQEFPDYWSQGETLEDLEEHLRDLYREVTSGEIPGVRRVRELAVS
jgi:predicted RNase H-like HicB family nuclease